MTDKMAVDFEAIQVLFEHVDSERSNIYEAIDKIRKEMDWAIVQSNMWRGADADVFKAAVTERLAQVYSISKWLNRIVYELREYAEQLKEQEQARADRMQSSSGM